MTSDRFIRLKEMTMTATAQPSPVGAPFDTHDPDPIARPMLPGAAEHYAAACGALADADSNGYNLAEVARLHRATELHLAAGDLALRIWPARLAELQTIAAAARDLATSSADTTDRAEAFDRLTAAVLALEADA
jgi:hypothetical protein